MAAFRAGSCVRAEGRACKLCSWRGPETHACALPPALAQSGAGFLSRSFSRPSSSPFPSPSSSSSSSSSSPSPASASAAPSRAYTRGNRGGGTAFGAAPAGSTPAFGAPAGGFGAPSATPAPGVSAFGGSGSAFGAGGTSVFAASAPAPAAPAFGTSPPALSLPFPPPLNFAACAHTFQRGRSRRRRKSAGRCVLHAV